jgi:hypothetical protein
VAAWGPGKGLARHPKCVHSPTHTSRSAYLEERGEKEGGKKKVTCQHRIQSTLISFVSEQTVHCYLGYISLFSHDSGTLQFEE